jgi:hypothetical protein
MEVTAADRSLYKLSSGPAPVPHVIQGRHRPRPRHRSRRGLLARNPQAPRPHHHPDRRPPRDNPRILAAIPYAALAYPLAFLAGALTGFALANKYRLTRRDRD